MTVSVCVVAHSEREDEGKDIGTYSYDVSNIRKDDASGPNYYFGRVNIEVNGVAEPFDVSWWDPWGQKPYYEVSRKVSKWYWYPAQTLQIAAIPIDFVAGIIWFGAYGISQVRHAEQSAAPLPRVPAGHSEGTH